MDDFLRKIKLLDQITIELNSHKTDFIKKFRAQVDYSDLRMSDSFFEEFSSSKNDYKGNIDDRVFRLRRRRKLFDTNRNFAIAEGKMMEEYDKLILEIDIIGFYKNIKIFIIFIILFYIVFLSVFISTLSSSENEIPFFIPLLVCLQVVFMIAVPYIIMRKCMTRMKYELERDFHFWMK